MILIAIMLGVISAVAVNGLADNLMREDAVPLRNACLPHCHYCGSPRKFADWSAILSTLFFSGRCLRCSAPRPFRDLAVEAVLWLGFPVMVMTGRSGMHALLVGGFILSACVLFSVLDFEHRAVIVEVVALASLALLLDGLTGGTEPVLRMLGGGLAGFVIFVLLFFLGKLLSMLFGLGGGTEPLGFGDVILAAFIGFITGWPAILLAIFVSIFLGGITGLGLAVAMVFKRSSLRNVTMAYGPYLLMAGLLVYFYGTPFMGGIINIMAAF
jgi:leader peptidase (prepilin peptidase)/N-methyltransferase